MRARPYFKKSHSAWYVQVGRKQIRLGTDKEEAFKVYHQMMAGELPTTRQTPVVVLLDQFLAWTKENRAASTFSWYLKHLQSFTAFIGRRRTAAELKPNDVTRWLSTVKGGDSWKNGAGRAVARAFNWARKQGLIRFNPIEGFEKPAATHRECYLSPDQWKTAIALLSDADPARDILIFLRETGARPFEARIAEGRHFDRKGRRLIFELRNSKGKRTRRVIRLNDTALAIVTKLVDEHPEGPIFRNRSGRPWSQSALIQVFQEMEKQLDFEFHAYVLRHSFCTDALLRGVDPVSVSILLGHQSPEMVFKTYQHLNQQDAHLQKMLKQATGEG